ncbi:hypothetical protein GCM10009670_11160 [Citricoccus alkalitolerans]
MCAGTESWGATTPGVSVPSGAFEPGSPRTGPSGAGPLWLVEGAGAVEGGRVFVWGLWDMTRSYLR